MNKFKLTLNKSRDEKPNSDGHQVSSEEKNRGTLLKKKKRSLMDVKKKKIATVKGYCTKENKALFAAYCKQNDISESSYIEKSIQKAIKSLKAKEKG